MVVEKENPDVTFFCGVLMFQNVLLLRIQDIVFSVHNNTTLKRSQFLLDWLILCAKPFGHVHCEFGDMSRCGSCYSVNCKLCSGFLKAFLSGSIIRHNVTASLVSVSFS